MKFCIEYKKYFTVIWIVTAACMAYILGGNQTVVAFCQRGGIYDMIVLTLILVTSYFMSGFCCEKFHWDRKGAEFSWKLYKRQFCERYQCNRLDLSVLAVAVVTGGILRLAGYDWGKTSIFHPDEWNFVNPAMEMVISHNAYQTSTFFYPAQMLSKIAALFIWLYSKFTGTEIVIYQTPEAFFIYRVIVAVLGTATIFTCFLIGNSFKRHLGAIVAVLVALYPVYVVQAKHTTGDVAVFFFLSLTMLFSLRYMENRNNIFLVLMTMGAAMATLEKWHGAIGIGYTGFIILLNAGKIKEIFVKGIYALTAYFAWILLLSPNLIFNFKTAIIDGFLNVAVWDGQEGPPYYTMLWNYAKIGIQHYGGIIYLAALFLGLIYIMRYFDKRYMVFLLGILKILILCFINRQFVRWGMELYFDELMLASFGIYWLIQKGKKYKWIYAAGGVMTLIIILSFMSGSMVEVMIATQSYRDTRLTQKCDCAAVGITPDNSVSAYYTGFVPGGITDKTWGFVEQGRLGQYLDIVDGGLYRLEENIDYAILNISDIREPELVDLIRKSYPLVLSYEAAYSDAFWDPLLDSPHSWNDIRLLQNNIDIAIDIYKGASVGRCIEVYDIRQAPCQSLEAE